MGKLFEEVESGAILELPAPVLCGRDCAGRRAANPDQKELLADRADCRRVEDPAANPTLHGEVARPFCLENSQTYDHLALLSWGSACSLDHGSLDRTIGDSNLTDSGMGVSPMMLHCFRRSARFTGGTPVPPSLPLKYPHGSWSRCDV